MGLFGKGGSRKAKEKAAAAGGDAAEKGKGKKKKNEKEKNKKSVGCSCCCIPSRSAKKKLAEPRKAEAAALAETVPLYTLVGVKVKSVQDGDGLTVRWQPGKDELGRAVWDLVNQLNVANSTFDKQASARLAEELRSKHGIVVEEAVGTPLKELRLRFRGIDAPERKQEYGDVAWEFVKRAVSGRDINVRVYNTDRYGRAVADVILLPENRVLNELLVEEGLAWHYAAFDSREHMMQLEAKAKRERKGLWQSSNPVPPWEFRKAASSANGKISSASKKNKKKT